MNTGMYILCEYYYTILEIYAMSIHVMIHPPAEKIVLKRRIGLCEHVLVISLV